MSSSSSNSPRARFVECQVNYVDKKLPEKSGVYMTNLGALYFSGEHWQEVMGIDDTPEGTVTYWLGAHYFVD